MIEEPMVKNVIQPTNYADSVRFVPFSQSEIWQAHRDYFVQHGPEVWGQNDVPFYITSSAYMAQTYTQLILVFLRDWVRTATQPPEKCYIVELGAGHGQLSFFLLAELLPLLAEDCELQGIDLCYVLTDLSAKNVEAWHPPKKLQAYFAQGLLDCVCFDVVAEQQITLLCSGDCLTTDSFDCPLLVLANYIFDGIPEAKLLQTRQRFQHWVTDRNPDDYVVVKRIVESRAAEPDWHELHPYHSDSHFGLALCYQRLGDEQQAQTCNARALQLEPGHESARCLALEWRG